MNEKYRITKETLESILSSTENIIRIKDYIFPQGIVIDIKKRAGKSFFFINCLFENSTTIDVSGDKEIVIMDSEFYDNLIINSPQNKSAGSSPRISIIRISINFQFILIDSVFSEIQIDDSKITTAKIKNISLTSGDISFVSCEIKEYLSIESLISKEGIWLDLCSIRDIKIDIFSGRAFIIDNTKISASFYISNLDSNIEWSGLKVDGDTLVKNSISKNIVIESSTFSQSIQWHYDQKWWVDNAKHDYKITTLDIESSDFKGGLALGIESTIKEFLAIKEITFTYTSSSKGDIFFQSMQVENCYFVGINKESSIHFFDCSILKSLCFDELVNHGRIIFTGLGLTKDTIISFDRTILGPAHFSAIDFNIPKISFLESDISQITWSAVQWPLEIPSFYKRPSIYKAIYWKKHFYKRWLCLHWTNISNQDNEVIFYTNFRDFYRQLKLASDKMQDRVQSLAFLCAEMKAHEKVLKLTKKAFNLERIILFVGRSNDHGQNWWRPVWLALVFTALIYIPIAIGIDPNLSLSGNDQSLSTLEQIVSWHHIIPQLLNPVHSLDKMTPSPATIHPATFWLDYIHRIVMAFLIFQTVSAFRKYVKT